MRVAGNVPGRDPDHEIRCFEEILRDSTQPSDSTVYHMGQPLQRCDLCCDRPQH